MTESGGHLLHNLLLFGRLLRRLGLDVGPGRVTDLVQALPYVNVGNRDEFYHTLRCLLVTRKEQIPLFDQAFALFWRERGRDLADLERPGATSAPRPVIAPPALVEPEPPSAQSALQDEEEQLVLEVTRTYSRRERLRHKDFAELTAEEMAEVKGFMAELVWNLGERRTRRSRPGRGRHLDLRRSLRRNLRYGGEIMEWPRRARKEKPRPLVILADVSGSMESYTRLLLHFVYSLAAGHTRQVEAFVFSTRLTRITRQLRGRELNRALRQVAQAVPDWSGGTRIGEAVKAFNFRWARRVLGRGAVVLLISDGWDRGDPALLGREMARLQRSCHRLIWLNPLLGSPQFEPLTRGLQAALPHVDDFLPAHNLASLEDLAAHLARLGAKHSSRRRRPRFDAFPRSRSLA